MNKSLLLAIHAVCLSWAANGQAQVYSSVVGFNTITALGNSDTRFSVPLHRSSVYQELVQSVSGNVITVQGLPGWTLNQLVYAAGSQTNTYYVSVGSGSKTGMYYTVTANSVDSGTSNTTTLTLDLAGDVINGGVVNGNSILIIPYWTFATLFPNQQGITTTTSISGGGTCTRVFIPDLNTAGVDLAAVAQYYYYSGTGFGGAGWRRSGGGASSIKNNDPISPDAFLIVRQDGVGTSAIITATGSVPMGERKYIIGTVNANVEQDNAVAVDVPVPLTLTQSNLFQSGAFIGTASISGSGGDKLFVFDDATVGFNKAAFKQYYYFTGAGFGGAGWRLSGGGATSIRNSDLVFQPGSGYVIRKIASPSPASVVWTLPATF